MNGRQTVDELFPPFLRVQSRTACHLGVTVDNICVVGGYSRWDCHGFLTLSIQPFFLASRLCLSWIPYGTQQSAHIGHWNVVVTSVSLLFSSLKSCLPIPTHTPQWLKTFQVICNSPPFSYLVSTLFCVLDVEPMFNQSLWRTHINFTHPWATRRRGVPRR
jgi:hypothetical protein